MLQWHSFLSPVRGHNYQNDKGGYLVDFLNSNECAKSEMKEVDDEEDELILLLSTEDQSLDPAEDDNLYNFCGYIINSELKKMKLSCESCLKVLLATKEEIEENNYCTLVSERDYTGSSLKYCSPLVFNDIFKPCQLLSNSIEKSLDFLTKENCAKKLVKVALNGMEKILPSCHNLQERLVERFFIMQ